MKIGTRLLLILLPVVAAVMTAYALWALKQRENTVVAEARQYTEAYASALGLALEQAFEDLGVRAVQNIVSQASLEPRIYRVHVFDSTGAVVARSDTLGSSNTGVVRLTSVIETGTPTSFYGEVDGQPMFTVLRPLHEESGRVRAGLEVVQPLDVVAAENASIRRRFLFNTLTLLVAVTAASLVAVQRSVTTPLRRLVVGVRAFGGGDLTRRVPLASSGTEVNELAREFNKMADSLEAARQKLISESEERLALDRQMRQAEKITAIGRLAVGLAHEIAAPLNVISGRANLASRRADNNSEVQRHLQIITAQITRISAIVRRLLDFARRPAAQRVPMDLVGSVDAIVEFLETEFRRADVRVEREGNSPCWVRADPDQIQQALINIILNAVQAMTAVNTTRHLTIRCHRVPGDATDGDGSVRLDILDTGPGISSDVLPTIFEPFVTDKEEGTGLGLAVAKSIIEEHGGTIFAQNRPDTQGAHISIVLSATTAPVHADA